MGKALSYSFISSKTPNYDANSPHDNPYNTLRIGLQDKLINLTPFLRPHGFQMLSLHYLDILTQCGINFSTFLFVQATLTLHVKLYRTISIKYNLKQNKTLFSSLAPGFFKILTAEIVNDVNSTHRKKPKLALPISKSHDNFSDTLYPFVDNQTPSINNINGITSPPTFYTKRQNKFRLTRLKVFPKRQPLSQPTIKYPTSMLPSSQEQNPTLPNYPTTDVIQHDNYTNQHDNLTTQPDNLTDNISFTNGTDSALQTDIEHLPSTFNFSQLPLFTIDLKIQIHHPPHPTVTLRVITQTPTKVDRSTR